MINKAPAVLSKHPAREMKPGSITDSNISVPVLTQVSVIFYDKIVCECIPYFWKIIERP